MSVTLYWKRIAYWISVIIVVIPVLMIDYTYFQLDFAPLTGWAAAIITQLMCAVYFVILSWERRFHLAWRWLVGFAGTGFLVLVMIVICVWF